MKTQPMKKLNLFKYVSGCSKILATTSYRTTPHRETNSEMGFEEDSGISGLGMIMKCKHSHVTFMNLSSLTPENRGTGPVASLRIPDRFKNQPKRTNKNYCDHKQFAIKV